MIVSLETSHIWTFFWTVFLVNFWTVFFNGFFRNFKIFLEFVFGQFLDVFVLQIFQTFQYISEIYCWFGLLSDVDPMLVRFRSDVLEGVNYAW